MIKTIYQHVQGDGYAPGYVELAIESAADLTNLTVATGDGTVMAPAPGSTASTPGMAEVYQVDVNGNWVQV